MVTPAGTGERLDVPREGASALVPSAAPPRTAAPVGPHPALLDPSLATEHAPPSFVVRFETTAGPFDMACERVRSPFGADRIWNLVKIGYFTDIALFRVVTEPRPFVIQFGIHGDPAVSARWRKATLPAEPVRMSNTRGTVSFAMAGSPDTRATQLFINLGDNAQLDRLEFAPVCTLGADADATLKAIYAGYGERITAQQTRIENEGNAFLREAFPDLDYIESASIVASGK